MHVLSVVVLLTDLFIGRQFHTSFFVQISWNSTRRKREPEHEILSLAINMKFMKPTEDEGECA